MEHDRLHCYGNWLLCLKFFLFAISSATATISRPPIIWDPYHPLFACEDPIVYVKEADTLKFVCPNLVLSSNHQASVSTLHETASLLHFSQENDFKNCNSTVSQTLLSCAGEYKDQKIFVRELTFGPNTPTFKPGHTYFVIGTSYRYQKNSTQKIGGSCSNNDLGGHRLRLKIHVCSEAEEKEGKCDICSAEGCYYKSCGKSCQSWEDKGTIRRGDLCYNLQKRTCNNTIFQDAKEEYKEELTNCNQVVTGALSNDATSNENEVDIYKYLVGGVGVVALLIGILVGVLVHKTHHGRSCGNATINPTDIESKAYSNQKSLNVIGTDNKAFQVDRNSMHVTK